MEYDGNNNNIMMMGNYIIGTSSTGLLCYWSSTMPWLNMLRDILELSILLQLDYSLSFGLTTLYLHNILPSLIKVLSLPIVYC